MARPKEYKADYHPEQAKELCLLGYTNKDLARVFDVAERTINRWMNDHNEFCQAVMDGREIADGQIAASFSNVPKGTNIHLKKL